MWSKDAMFSFDLKVFIFIDNQSFGAIRWIFYTNLGTRVMHFQMIKRCLILKLQHQGLVIFNLAVGCSRNVRGIKKILYLLKKGWEDMKLFWEVWKISQLLDYEGHSLYQMFFERGWQFLTLFAFCAEACKFIFDKLQCKYNIFQ